jgi:two-component system sensor histidine kinase GlrK
MAELSALAAADRSELVARAVHDLRTPLQIIRGHTFTMRRRGGSGRQHAGLSAIDAEVMRLSAALDDLLALVSSRDAVGRPPSAVSLAGLAAGLARRHAGAAARRGILLESRVRGAPAIVTADPAELRRALDNLLQNALRHAAPGGTVRITVASEDGEGLLEVADDGPGIAPRDRERVFRPGVRGPEAPGRGTGLGLAIARDVAEAQGGRLELLPSSRGARFRLSLPLRDAGRASRRG